MTAKRFFPALLAFWPSRPPRALTPEEAAADWLVRRDSPRWGRADERALARWLSESDANGAAFARAEEAWARFDDAGDDALLRSMRRSALAIGRDGAEGRWRAFAAAGVVAITLAGLAWLVGGGRVTREAGSETRAVETARSAQAALSRRGEADYATVRGERADVTLPDGTRVTLNTDSAIDIAFEPDRRVVRLLRGQAYFDVARDAAHPFLVEAADRRITAIGTAFDVRLDPASLRVLLVSGRVRIDRDGLGAAAGGAPVELHPGELLTFALGAPPDIARTDIVAATAWRRGLVQFNDISLGEAVSELNRYTSEPLVIRDSEIAEWRISGVFRTGDPERFGRTLSELLPVEVRRGGAGEIQLMRRAAPARAGN